MTTSIKLIVGVVIIVAVAAVLWYMGILAPLLGGGAVSETPTTTQQQVTQGPPSDLPTQSNDTSDAAIAQDAAAIDAEISALTSDSGQMDQSMNDKSIEQEY